MKKTIMPVEPTRSIRLAPHRFGQVGNMLVIEDDDGDRLDLYLTDAQLRQIATLAKARLSSVAASAAYRRLVQLEETA